MRTKKLISTIVALSSVVLLASMSNSVNADEIVHPKQPDQTGKLYLHANSYIYTKSGKRTSYAGKWKLLKDESVKYTGTIKPLTKNYKYYFKDNQAQKYWLPYRTYHKYAYYQIANNKYVKVANVSEVNGNYIIARDQVVKPKKGAIIFTPNGQYNKESYSWPNFGSSQKLTSIKSLVVDSYVETADGNHTVRYYHIKGTSNQYIRDPYLSTQPKFSVEAETSYTAITAAKAISLYDATGKAVSSVRKNHLMQGIERIYLWVPADNQAELFYRISDTQNSTPLYVKVADVRYEYGPSVKMYNSAKDAQTTFNKKADKTELEQLIKSADSVRSTAKYLNSTFHYRANFDSALKLAKQAAQAKSSQMEIDQAVWFLQQELNSLQGNQITVNSYDHLTNDEAKKITQMATNLYSAKYDKSSKDGKRTSARALMINHNTKLVLEITETGYTASGYQTVDKQTYTDLKLSDFAKLAPKASKVNSSFESSDNQTDLASDATLSKYAQLIKYDDRTSVLVAKTDTPIYQAANLTEQALRSGDFSLTKTGKMINKGNNIGYLVGPVVKLDGNYYLKVEAKTPYFVRANDVKLDNFANSAEFKKYDALLKAALNNNYRVNEVGLKLTNAKIPVYAIDSYGNLREIITETLTNIASGTNDYAYYLNNPFITKYNGEFYYRGLTSLSSVYKATDVIPVKAQGK